MSLGDMADRLVRIEELLLKVLGERVVLIASVGDVPEWAEWAGMDKDGTWVYFQGEPTHDHEEWLCGKDHSEWGRLEKAIPFSGDWTDSKMRIIR